MITLTAINKRNYNKINMMMYNNYINSNTCFVDLLHNQCHIMYGAVNTVLCSCPYVGVGGGGYLGAERCMDVHIIIIHYYSYIISTNLVSSRYIDSITF